VREAVISTVEATLGTMVETSAPLMSAGLDSLSVAEVVNALSTRLEAELAPTDLFDHPTLESIVSFLSARARSPTAPVEEQASSADARPAPREPASSAGQAGQRVVSVPAWSFEMAWRLSAASELRALPVRAFAANTHVPAA
jgi:acyl carrier protein